MHRDIFIDVNKSQKCVLRVALGDHTKLNPNRHATWQLDGGRWQGKRSLIVTQRQAIGPRSGIPTLTSEPDISFENCTIDFRELLAITVNRHTFSIPFAPHFKRCQFRIVWIVNFRRGLQLMPHGGGLYQAISLSTRRNSVDLLRTCESRVRDTSGV